MLQISTNIGRYRVIQISYLALSLLSLVHIFTNDTLQIILNIILLSPPMYLMLFPNLWYSRKFLSIELRIFVFIPRLLIFLEVIPSRKVREKMPDHHRVKR
jgi:hypothetical protein